MIDAIGLMGKQCTGYCVTYYLCIRLFQNIVHLLILMMLVVVRTIYRIFHFRQITAIFQIFSNFETLEAHLFWIFDFSSLIQHMLLLLLIARNLSYCGILLLVS